MTRWLVRRPVRAAVAVLLLLSPFAAASPLELAAEGAFLAGLHPERAVDPGAGDDACVLTSLEGISSNCRRLDAAHRGRDYYLVDAGSRLRPLGKVICFYGEDGVQLHCSDGTQITPPTVPVDAERFSVSAPMGADVKWRLFVD